jgi:hypothetical protein
MSVFHSFGDAAFHGEVFVGQFVPLSPPDPVAND